ncbi:hypothetical protein CI15_21145 [Paraburkholderia monticola]|uniref:Uncharacterized protein n=1 Tax=Paraburkholderia monticola TaxID=1399968 RepID=A0A149PIG4_9BURK|nr:hypothetical protein CI15_21145 [Paraburkholderia monticola]
MRTSFQKDSASAVVTHAHSQDFNFMIARRRESRADDDGNIGRISGLETFQCSGATIVTIQIEIEEYQVGGRCFVDFFQRAGKRKYGRGFDWDRAQLRRVRLNIFGKSNAKNLVVIDP